MTYQNILALRMRRQHLAEKASRDNYDALYRDLQPGQNVYWNGFGQPPELTFRASFDDREYNRVRQSRHELIKGRFAGGNLGWIMPEDLELFAALYRKPLVKPTPAQAYLLELIEHEGPLTIQQMKQGSGMLVKEITPALHRLQEAFLIYEDQTDGEWDRGWCRFSGAFPDCDLERYTRREALKIVLRRFAYRMVAFDSAMAKSFYRLPEKEINAAIAELISGETLAETGFGYVLRSDLDTLETCTEIPRSVYAMHRNDFLVKSFEHVLKERFKPLCEHLEYDHEPLQYLLIDGEFRGASVGHFRNGPYDLNDVVLDLDDPDSRRDEIIDAISTANFGKKPERFTGKCL